MSGHDTFGSHKLENQLMPVHTAGKTIQQFPAEGQVAGIAVNGQHIAFHIGSRRGQHQSLRFNLADRPIRP